MKGDLEYYNEPEITNTETQTDEVTNYNYTITNTYKLKEVDLNAEISKTGTEEITTKEDKISYTIKFTAEVPDYVGKGTITIVDKLPFAIDEENSTLDEGVYNEAKRTITWEEERDIDTEELGESYKIDMTKEIELAYKGVDLTQEKMTNNVIGKVKLEATDEVDVDSTGCDTNINVEGKVTIRYVDKETGEDILGTENEPYTYEITGKIGSTYNAEIKEIEGYNYVDEGKATGTIQEEEQEIVLYYISNEARVIVKYQDKEGNKIAEDKIIEGHIGESYKTEAKQIENYRYIETKGEEEGTITEKETIVIYVYEKIATGKVTVRYVDQDTEKDIEKINPDDSTITNYTYEITGNIGEEYETEQKEIPYYIYVRSTENTKGTIKEGTDTVIYYYRKQVFNFSIEKTLAGVTLNGQEVQIKDNKLAKIELKPSEIENTSVIADYKIKVTNKGELAGTAKVVDKLPEGYKGLIVPDYWKENGDGTLEAEVELGVGESKELTITLIWENSEENLGPKSNKAELVGGENLANYEDTNKDDDISEATIVISIKTGETVSIIILIMLTISCIISGYLIFWVAPRKGKESNIKDIRFLNK